MVKVLHVIRNIGDGGTERFMMNVINNSKNKDIKNIIVTYDEVIKNWQDVILKKNIKIIVIDDPNKTGLFKNVKNIFNVIKKEQIDVVYSYTHYNSGYVMLAAFLAGIKIRITHSHRTESNSRNSLFYNIYAKISKLLINIFSNVKLACGKEAGDSLFYKHTNYTIIKNGIEIDKYEFSNLKRKSLRKEYGIGEKDIVIGTVGRLDKNKNQKFLIDVFYEYTKLNSNSKLVIIGDGVEKANLVNQSKKLHISDKVIFMGSRDDVNELYNVIDVFLLTSYNEGLPFVLIEAQTNGLKCIVSDSVSREANISKSIVYKSIHLSPKIWAEEIKNSNLDRINCVDSIVESGYSINDTVCELEKIYNL